MYRRSVIPTYWIRGKKDSDESSRESDSCPETLQFQGDTTGSAQARLDFDLAIFLISGNGNMLLSHTWTTAFFSPWLLGVLVIIYKGQYACYLQDCLLKVESTMDALASADGILWLCLTTEVKKHGLKVSFLDSNS